MRASELPFVGIGDERVASRFRRPTPGPEFELLSRYLERSLPVPNPEERMAVFVEPRLETGCPDAVAVYWRPDGTECMRTLEALTVSDDRLVQFVWVAGSVRRAALVDQLGPAAAKRARELVEMGLLSEVDGEEICVAQHSLVLSRLIAIEAKLRGPSSALSQAARNTWFASESFALLPNLPTASSLCARYKACGVGILTPGDQVSDPSLPARRQGLPQSHVTWRFNRLARQLSAQGAA
ncbi:MAG: hypothetical protein U1E22_09550 [Coriobacteriia bacterium]|nr:hypothetical protein [Coriobacteriia bacterium]MDZ4179169.1 hypothetical protein [Coriobacteriia bacterium]